MFASRRCAALIGAVFTILAASPLKADEPLPEKRVALVIGNSHYQHAPELANPAPDAHAVSEAFRRLGIEVTEGYDLNEREMRSLLIKFANTMPGAKGAIVFYAGHGVALDGVNYMLPTDIDLKSPADLDLGGVSVDLVLRQMRRDDRVNVIILDACRDNPFAAALSRSVTRAAVSSRGLQAIAGDLARGALIAFATEPGNTAFDGPAGAHSPFTAALLRHIEDPATPIENVMSKVRGEVFAATSSKQLPWVNTSIVGDFELNPKKAEPVAPPAPREAAATQTTENLLWESAERSRAAEDYKTYLAAFPNGVFAPVAKRRIEAAAPVPPEAAEAALQLSPTDRAMTRKALIRSGGGDPFDDSIRVALRDWQKDHGFPVSGYLDGVQLARLKEDAATRAAPAQPVVNAAPVVVTPPPKKAAALTQRKAIYRAPVVRSVAPVVVAKPRYEAKSEPKEDPKPVARRPRPHATYARTYSPADDDPPPAPAPSYGGSDGYMPSYGPVIAAPFSTGIHFGGFGHHHGWSDRRLKRDVCRIGVSPSGIPVYTFRYKTSDAWYTGAMAQDLLILKPQAVRQVGAYYQVDYDQIDVRFTTIARPGSCAAGQGA